MNEFLKQALLYKNRILFFKKNWKLGVHLLLNTKKFGVNNEWWSRFDSVVWGKPTINIILDIVKISPTINNYRGMKFRAGALHFMTDEQYLLAFGKAKNADRKKLKSVFWQK